MLLQFAFSAHNRLQEIEHSDDFPQISFMYTLLLCYLVGWRNFTGTLREHGCGNGYVGIEMMGSGSPFKKERHNYIDI